MLPLALVLPEEARFIQRLKEVKPYYRSRGRRLTLINDTLRTQSGHSF